MHKQSFLENMSPEQRGALIGGLVGAGGLGLTAAAMSKKNKMRNAILAALAGGLGGAGLGYLHGGGSLFSNKPAPDKPSNDRVAIDPKTGKPPEYEGGFQGFKPIPGLAAGLAGPFPEAVNPNTGKPPEYEGGFQGFKPIPGLSKVMKDAPKGPLENFADQEAPELPAAGGPGSSFKQPKA